MTIYVIKHTDNIHPSARNGYYDRYFNSEADAVNAMIDAQDSSKWFTFFPAVEAAMYALADMAPEASVDAMEQCRVALESIADAPRAGFPVAYRDQNGRVVFEAGDTSWDDGDWYDEVISLDVPNPDRLMEYLRRHPTCDVYSYSRIDDILEELQREDALEKAEEKAEEEAEEEAG